MRARGRRALPMLVLVAALSGDARAAETDVLVVAWNYSQQDVYRVDARAATSVRVSSKGLGPDGSRAWSPMAVSNGRRARIEGERPSSRARTDVFWRYASPDGRRMLVGHGYEGTNAAIEWAELVESPSGLTIATFRFGRKRFVHDMLWLPDSSAIVLLDVDTYLVNLGDALRVITGHGSWASDVYAHIVDAETGKARRVVVATGVRTQSIALAQPDLVVP